MHLASMVATKITEQIGVFSMKTKTSGGTAAPIFMSIDHPID